MKIEPEKIDTEYKTASGGRLPKDIWKSVVAFANTDGGTIYFGVSPDGKEIKLTRDQADKIQRDIINLCHDGSLSTQFLPEVRVLGSNKTVMVVIPAIQAALRPVYSARHGMYNGTYVRVGSENVKADRETITRFLVAARGGAEQIWYSESYAHVLDLGEIENFIEMLNRQNHDVYRDFDLAEVLIKQRIISKDRKKVSLYGLLGFAKDRELQDLVAPTINIAVTQYAGSEILTQTDLAETYRVDQEFNGNVINQFTQALAYIKNKIPARWVVGANGQRELHPAIPDVALREALANALVHRDYSVTGARIQVNIYENRLEIINPGASLIPINQLDSAPSLTRNPLVMNLLKEYGIVEQKGRGIRTIYRSIRDEDLTEPVFENIGGQAFRVTLYNTSALSSADKEFLASFAPEINRRQKNAIVYAKKHPEGINNGEYRKINEMQLVRDDKKANKELNELVRLGIFRMVGIGRWRRYLLIPPTICD